MSRGLKEHVEDIVIGDCCGLSLAILTRRQNIPAETDFADEVLRRRVIEQIDEVLESLQRLRHFI
jgi:hypothetical protein